MTLSIEVWGLRVRGHHGVLESERRDGQLFLVDVVLQPSSAAGATTDAIEDAVDYRRVVDVVQSVSGGKAFRLLEAFASTLADELLDQLPIDRVRVRVRKPEVRLDLPVEHTAAVVERERRT